MEYTLKDKVVIITGGATGIGALVVRYLLEEKVKYIGILDVDTSNGIALENELNLKYGVTKVKFFHCDVTNDDQLFAAFKSVFDNAGYIDLMINNAGIMNDSLRLYKKEIELNVTALVTGTLKALELMRKDQGGKGGAVINISSVASLSCTPNMPIYWATKSAVTQFSNCIGHKDYYSRTGVRVLVICYGATRTSLISAHKLGSYDPQIDKGLVDALEAFPVQRPESAARGLIEVYKQGESGSTWLVASDKPAQDISAIVHKSFELYAKLIFN